MEERAVQGQRNLATFMKILLVKRLESSFHAFQETLARFIKSHELVLQAFDDGSVYTSRKHSNKVLEFLEEGDDDAIADLIAQEKAEESDAAKFTPDFRQHVASDLAMLRQIQTSWKAIKRDPKWIEFKRQLTTTLARGKLIIFTEFADTARYLAEKIKKDVEPETLLFSSTSSPELRRAVIANFDANKKEPLDDYRILITTDVLAEGVNLHRSATVINYDIPWNPSRMMQRVGRVNRVGTKFKTIFSYNFFPPDEGNDQIALTESAKSKIAAFISLLGSDARLLTGDEQITSHNLFDRINSEAAAEGGEEEQKSELKYLRQILDVKEKQPELFQRILALPRKARSTRHHAPEPGSAEHPDTVTPSPDRPAVITYFRQDRLHKIFRSHADIERAEELDFFTTAETLETTASEKRREIPPEQFYPLLDKNKDGFQSATTPSLDTLRPATAAGSGNEAIILKRLHVGTFRRSSALTPEDKKFGAAVHQIIADGRVGKATIRRVKEGSTRPTNPWRSSPFSAKKSPASIFLARRTNPTRPRSPPRAKSSFPPTSLDAPGTVMV